MPGLEKARPKVNPVSHSGQLVSKTAGAGTGTNFESGNCLSLCRMPEGNTVEVMIRDQMNHKTRQVALELSLNETRVRFLPLRRPDLSDPRKHGPIRRYRSRVPRPGGGVVDGLQILGRLAFEPRRWAARLNAA